MTKYFVGEIDLPNGNTHKRLIRADNLSDAHEKIERYIRQRIPKYPTFALGSFKIRTATTEEILVDDLTDFAGGWDEYNIQGFAEDIIETVLETLPKDALIEELERRKEEGDYY
jgi:hypothetical protein